jgi:hypothetical protein
MKANELRIGNLVYNTKGEVDAVNMDALKYLVAYGGTSACQVKPIPLTEEWLLRFGFKKWGRDDLPRTLSYELGRMRIFPANSFCDFSGYGFLHYKPVENESTESAEFSFQHVHQLQNLYSAMTGEELELKS